VERIILYLLRRVLKELLLAAAEKEDTEIIGPFVLVVGKILFGTLLECCVPEAAIFSFNILPVRLPYPKLIKYKQA